MLSEATRDYDRGEKFGFYKAIPSLRDYVLIEQDRPLVAHWQRRTRAWSLKTLRRLDGVVKLRAIDILLPLRETYRAVLPKAQ